MSESLPIQNESFPLREGVVDVEVFGSDEVLVEVELTEVPANKNRES